MPDLNVSHAARSWALLRGQFMSNQKKDGISRRSMLFGTGGGFLALAAGLTSSPSRVLAQMWKQDLEAHVSAFRSSIAAYLKHHGQYAPPRAFSALIDYVGSDKEKAFEGAIARIFRTGGRFIRSPARSHDEALRKYLILSEFYHRMHIEDASRRFSMHWDHWKDWLDAMDADLDKFDVNVNRWWRAGGLEGVYIDDIKHRWNGKIFEPMDQWYDVAA